MPKRHRGTVRPIRTYPGAGAPAPVQARGRAQQAATVAADRRVGLAMVPLRLFLGLTFIYAGLDKVLFDPTFLDSAAPTSLLAQLQGFAHTSPLAPLITLIAEPLVGPIGLGMAVAEIAVGLGALTGLLPRASAWGGFAIAILLWLTASFAIHPYYLGPDLPYAAGWLTLALVGDGDVYTVRASRQPLAGRAGPGGAGCRSGASPLHPGGVAGRCRHRDRRLRLAARRARPQLPDGRAAGPADPVADAHPIRARGDPQGRDRHPGQSAPAGQHRLPDPAAGRQLRR